ncbi:phytanoyl-CoA dioxygenase family protein [Streptomyces sp. NPDC094034]|uniref:phytanoyl-CoA dioxygenase family protein n=1 Tax=Streptomyces sp. NPDC094034 TaxID=3155309 RepID=UPI00332B357B
MDAQQSSQEISTSSTGLTKDQAQRLGSEGFIILPGVLSEEDCDFFSHTIDEIWRTNRLGEIYRWETGVQFVPNLLQYSTIFERFVTQPLVLAAVREVLGPDFQLSLVNGRRVDPGAGNQPLHDLERRRGLPFVKCNAIWCLDEFTALNGPTRVLPGSHLTNEPFLSRIEDPLLPHPDEQLALAPRGSVVFHNSQLIHGGSENTADAPRRSVHSAFCLWTEPTRDDWSCLPSEIQSQLTPEAKKLLGL